MTHHQGPGPAYVGPGQGQRPKKGKGLKITLIIVGGVLTLCCVGGIAVAAASGDKSNTEAPSPKGSGVAASAVSAPVASNTSKAPAPQPSPTTPSVAPPPKAPTIDEGTYTVGEDVPAGTYKVTGAGSSCYWAIYKSGQNQSFDAIIDNHLGGGNLRVTLKAGQDFETKRCPTWTKV